MLVQQLITRFATVVASKTIHDSDRKDSAGTVQAAEDAILVGFPPS
jgi:hypothetical protein